MKYFIIIFTLFILSPPIQAGEYQEIEAVTHAVKHIIIDSYVEAELKVNYGIETPIYKRRCNKGTASQMLKCSQEKLAERLSKEAANE